MFSLLCTYNGKFLRSLAIQEASNEVLLNYHLIDNIIWILDDCEELYCMLADVKTLVFDSTLTAMRFCLLPAAETDSTIFLQPGACVGVYLPCVILHSQQRLPPHSKVISLIVDN